jgi:hypothetical protein
MFRLVSIARALYAFRNQSWPAQTWDGRVIHAQDARATNDQTTLFESVSDPASRQIVRRHLYANAIAYQNTYAVLAHFAGNGCQDDVSTIVQLDFEKCVGLFVDYRALRGNQIISCQIGFSFKT